MKVSYWGKVGLILSIVESGVIVCFQGIANQPFQWGAAFYASLIGFGLGVFVRSIQFRSKENHE
jgi:hypothetical protein